MRNTFKYSKLYSGGEPQFIEDDVFRTIIPLSKIATEKVGPQEQEQEKEEEKQQEKDPLVLKILEFCLEPHTKDEISAYCNYEKKYFSKKYLIPLLKSGKIKMTIPNKPTTRNQKYITNNEE